MEADVGVEVGAIQIAEAVHQLGVRSVRIGSGSYPGNGSGGSGSYAPRSGSSRSDSSLTSFLRVTVSPLQVAVIHQTVEAIHWEVEGIRLEVAVTPCSKRFPAPLGLEYPLSSCKTGI